jgi:L1 cell adhesion molecule like protein
LTKKDINQIILVGGSTRIPRVREIVKEYFPDCKINKDINPDEAVAYGATINA